MKKHYILLIYILFSGTLLAQSTILPEDGSVHISTWYYGDIDRTEQQLEVLEKDLRSEGVSPKFFGFNYNFLQDLVMFQEDGNVLLQADMPVDYDILYGLTMGVMNDDDGRWELTKVYPYDIKDREYGYREMKWTFLEGGGLITGKLKNNETYAILTDNGLWRTREYYKYLHGNDPGIEFAKELIAKDFNIKAENIFIVPIRTHIDLEMLALPGGIILLSDPKLTVKTAKKLQQQLSQNSKQYQRLQEIIIFYQHGYQRKDKDGNPIGTKVVPHEDYQIQELDETEKILQDKLKVIRVAGVINENQHSIFAKEKINLFNGFLGKNPEGETFLFTNDTDGLEVLKPYFRNILKKYGIKPEHVHFPGHYGGGAGLDCAGVIAP